MALLVAGTLPASACAVCFGAPGSDVNNAMAMAIALMLGILAVVLGLFVAFFLYLRRRAVGVPPDYAELTDINSSPTDAVRENSK